MQETKDIHIGKLIRKQLRINGQTAVWLAKQLNCDRSKLYRIFNNPTIYTDDLWRISTVLKHDFFADLSKCFSNHKK
jgi:DNA invertase Pin-like site-specific DNA recombinase